MYYVCIYIYCIYYVYDIYIYILCLLCIYIYMYVLCIYIYYTYDIELQELQTWGFQPPRVLGDIFSLALFPISTRAGAEAAEARGNVVSIVDFY